MTPKYFDLHDTQEVLDAVMYLESIGERPSVLTVYEVVAKANYELAKFHLEESKNER